MFIALVIGFIGFVLATFIFIVLGFYTSKSKSTIYGLLIPVVMVLISTLVLASDNLAFWNYSALVIATITPMGLISIGLMMNQSQRQIDNLGDFYDFGGSDIDRLNMSFTAGLFLGCIISVILYPLVWLVI